MYWVSNRDFFALQQTETIVQLDFHLGTAGDGGGELAIDAAKSGQDARLGRKSARSKRPRKTRGVNRRKVGAIREVLQLTCSAIDLSQSIDLARQSQIDIHGALNLLDAFQRLRAPIQHNVHGPLHTQSQSH